MSKGEQRRNTSWLSGLSEDWLAIIIGLGFVIFVWIGAITKVP